MVPWNERWTAVDSGVQEARMGGSTSSISSLVAPPYNAATARRHAPAASAAALRNARIAREGRMLKADTRLLTTRV